MQIEYKDIKDLIEYENNPRKNENAIKHVKRSIEQFGFKNPIIIDKNNVIVCGHTRFHAAKELNMNELPCIQVSDLNEEQIKSFRIVDNRTSEFSEWNFELLEQELKELDNIKPADIGFEEIKNAADFFESEDKENFIKKNDGYDEFVEKFKPEASTDECYTPKEIYDKVCDFVESEYNVSRDNFVRPFYPGGGLSKV